MRKTYKNIISLCAVLIFGLTISVTAFADPFSISIGLGGASGAGLFGSMSSASGISVGFPSGTSVSQADSVWNDVYAGIHVGEGSPFHGETGQKTVTDPQTGIPTVYDYIKVDISDWLQLQNDYIDEFVSTYSIDDNDSGTISSGRSYAGYPFNSYNIGPALGQLAVGQSYNIAIGSATLSATYYSGNVWYVTTTYNGNTIINNQQRTWTSHIGKYFVLYCDNNGNMFWGFTSNFTSYSWICNLNNPTSDTKPPFTTNWNSGTVDTSIYNDWQNPLVMIPANSWSPSDPTAWNPAEFLEELTVKRLQGLGNEIVIEDDQQPVPPPPVPTTPLGEVPYDDWYEDLGDLLGQHGEEVVEDVEGAIEGVEEKVEEATGVLENILDGVRDLVQEIVLSTETFIAGLLNSIIGGFGGWLSTMKQSFNIWHYVVEWVSSISSVFSWFWSMAGSTSYYIQLPIYASLAGAIVLAFYKRFGR